MFAFLLKSGRWHGDAAHCGRKPDRAGARQPKVETQRGECGRWRAPHLNRKTALSPAETAVFERIPAFQQFHRIAPANAALQKTEGALVAVRASRFGTARRSRCDEVLHGPSGLREQSAQCHLRKDPMIGAVV